MWLNTRFPWRAAVSQIGSARRLVALYPSVQSSTVVDCTGSVAFDVAEMPLMFEDAPAQIDAWLVGVTLGNDGRTDSAQTPRRNMFHTCGAVAESPYSRKRCSLNPSKL